jgi:peptidyl-prolyl cis-trans isomerase D
MPGAGLPLTRPAPRGYLARLIFFRPPGEEEPFMAMLIQKFHSLIQSRILWIVFLVIVVFSFVIWGSYAPGRRDTRDQERVAGILDGKPVPVQEYHHHYYAEYLNLTLRSFRPPPSSPELEEYLREAAWRRLASLRQAEQMGITVNNQEVVQAIKSDQMFSEGGRFNQAYYMAFVRQFLAGMRISERQFEEHVREEITRQKLHFMLSQAALVPPSELQRRFHMLSDEFVIDYVTFGPDQVEKEITVDEEEARAYFLGHPETFATPERVRVSYVQLAAATFRDDVEVTEEEVRAYYDDNPAEFIPVPETNETLSVEALAEPAAEPEPVADATDQPPAKRTRKKKADAAPAAEEAPAAVAAETATEVAADEADTGTEPIIFSPESPLQKPLLAEAPSGPQPRPFDDVKEELRERLRLEKALRRAVEKASDFVLEITPDRYGKAMAFEAAAEKHGLTIEEPVPFSIDEPPPEVDAGLEFTRAAFHLTENPVERFSDPVVGEEHVYVLYFRENIPSRVPEFEEVAGEATELARVDKVRSTIQRKVGEIREAAAKGLQEGQAFADAVKSFDLVPARTEPFSSMTGITNSLYSDVILRGILTRNAGEISDPIPVGDGFILAHVKSRRPGDPTQFSALKNQIAQTLAQREGTQLLRAWEEYLLHSQGLVDHMKKTSAGEEDEPAGASG